MADLGVDPQWCFRGRSLAGVLMAAATCLAPALSQADTVSVSLGDILSGKTLTIEFDASINGTLPSGVTQVSNQGTLASGTDSVLTDDPDAGGASDPTVTLLDVADLKTTKTASSPVFPGSDSTWTITVTNDGPNAAAAPSLTDALPTGTTFVSLAPPPGWACTTPSVGAAGTVACTTSSLPLGTAVFTLVAHVDAALPPGTLISNTATAGAATLDPVPANDSATAVVAVAARAAMSLTKTGAATVLRGDPLTYSVLVTNAGPDDAQSVAWVDSLPAGTTFESLSSVAGWSCTTPTVGAGGTVSCTTSTLGTEDSTFSLVVRVDPAAATGTVITNIATVSSSTSDPSPGDETGTATTTVAAGTDLALIKTAPGSVLPEGDISYLITVTNSGPDPAMDVVLSDALTPSLSFVSLSAPAGWTCSTPAVGATGTVSCSNASLGVTSAAFSLVGRVAAGIQGGAAIINTATVLTSTTDIDPSNNSGTASTAVLLTADLGVTMTGPDWVFPGQAATYRIEVTNAGPELARNTEVQNPTPSGVTLESLSGDCTTAFPCPLGDLPSGESRVITAVFRVPADYPSPDTLVSTASVLSDTTDPVPGNDQATAETAVNLPTAGLDFFALAACRIVDTRGALGPRGGPAVSHGESRTIPASGACGIPATAKALSVNIVVTAGAGYGHVSLFAAGPEPPVVSAINYGPGQTRANNATVALNKDGSFALYVFQPSLGTVHVIVDVNGYFE